MVSQMDPVKYIFEKPALTGRITRWQVLLSEFDIVYVTQKAIKGNALSDYWAWQPLNDYQPMHLEFLDEDIMAFFEEKFEDKDRDKWIVWFDGASNALSVLRYLQGCTTCWGWLVSRWVDQTRHPKSRQLRL